MPGPVGPSGPAGDLPGRFTLLPAVDVAGGRAVRGAGPASAGGDPLAAALRWQREGAGWVHLVDLDAAHGRGSNAELLAGIVRRLDVAVELAGGIRDDDSLAAALATGAARVVLAAAALADPGFVRRALARAGDRLAVGLDVRGERIAPRGRGPGGAALAEVLGWLVPAGAGCYLLTDVTRDGALTGPNTDLLARVCAVTGGGVLASGGVGSLADLRAVRALAPAGVIGLVLGAALHAGRFGLAEALAAAAGAG